MDRLAAMRTFVEIVDRGSLSAAADALDRSQPTVVRTLAALEKHLGAVLLRRTTRRMSLTPEGRDYLERCRQILADVDEAESVIGQRTSAPAGELRMTGPVEFGRLHLTPAIAEFLQRYEQIRIDLLLLDRNVDLIEEGIDLALRIGPLVDSAMVATHIGEVRRVTVGSPSLLERVGAPEQPDDLSRLPCIRQQNMPRAETVWLFKDQTRDIPVRIDGRFGVNQISASVSACLNGVGFGRFLSYQVQDLVSQGRLRFVLEGFEPDPWPVNLLYPGGRLMSSRLRILIDWLHPMLRSRRAIA